MPEDGSRDRWPGVPGDGSSSHEVHQDSHQRTWSALTVSRGARPACKA
jgi:hypothetical protein